VASEFQLAGVSPLGAAYWLVGIGFARFTTLTGSGTFILTSYADINEVNIFISDSYLT
jgi:hypothetical protein